MRLVIIISLIFVSFLSYTQECTEVQYEVNKVFPFISLSMENIQKATTLSDLDPRGRMYKSIWIKEFKSVDIMASVNGKTEVATGNDELLNERQKALITKADLGKEIEVRISYIPNNNLKYNDVKEISFDFWVNPQEEAAFVGGQKALNQYIEQNAISQIPSGTFTGYKITIITFTVTSEGLIREPELFTSCGDEAVDQAILSSVCNMPTWNPASYNKGPKVNQKCALLVGNMESCMVNTLNIKASKIMEANH